MLDLRGEGAQLRFEAVEAHAVGAAAVAAAIAGAGGAAATAAARQQFERADHDLHVDELLLELLDALLQAGICRPAGAAAFVFGLRLRRCRLRKLHGLGDDRRREQARQAGAAENRNEERCMSNGLPEL